MDSAHFKILVSISDIANAINEQVAPGRAEIHQPEAGKISNALNSNDQNKKLIGISFHRVANGYIFGISLVLNIGYSDFGFVSHFVFRASNFLGVFSPERYNFFLVLHQRWRV